MEVNGVNSGVTGANAYNAAANETVVNQTAVNEAAANEEKLLSDTAAVYEPSEKSAAQYKPDFDKIKEMIAESERQVSNFRKMIEGLFSKQAQKSGVVEAWESAQTGNLKDFIGSLEVDAETAAAAQKEIDEGGYYSVDETAKRILNFAVALSGGDPSKISVLKDAVDKGFKQAEEMWGDKLPEISQKTYEAVMNGFDEWEKAGSADAISLFSE